MTSFSQSRPSWPSLKPIRLIVPFTVGSGTDISARVLADRLSRRLQQQFVVENKPGASGVIGLDAAAKAAPDGYTFVLSGPGLAAYHVLFKKLPFDPVKDLIPVSLVYENVGGIIIHGGIPANSLAEFAAYASANPGKLNYGSLGKNTTMLTGEELKQMGNFPMTEVAYPGTPQIQVGLLRGDIHLSFMLIEPNLADIRGGRLKLLAVSGRKRAPMYPEVPAVTETYPEYQAPAWGGLLAPFGTPQSIVDRISAEVADFAATKEFREAMLKVSNIPVGGTPENFRQEINDNMRTWSRVAASANIQPD